MSRSCHRATFSSAAMALPRTRRASPTICSQPTGLRLCGIAEEPFWPLANGSSTSPISVFCRPRISSANFSSEAARDRQRRQQLGVAIALDDLRRDRGRLEAEAGADRRLDRRIEVGEGADRAGDLADRHGRRGPAAGGTTSRCSSAYQCASFRPKVIGSAWTPCVRPIIAVRRCSSARRADDRQQPLESGEDQVATPRPSAAPARCRRRRTRSGRSAASARSGRRARRRWW